jgi:hypothetical protein
MQLKTQDTVILGLFQNHIGLLTSPKSHSLYVHLSCDMKSALITKNGMLKQIFIFFKHRSHVLRICPMSNTAVSCHGLTHL